MIKRLDRVKTATASTAVAAVCLLWVEAAHANRLGIIQRSGLQEITCSECHSGGVAPAVRFIGPQAATTGQVATYRFEVESMIPSQRAAGFNVAAGGGTLGIVPDQGAQLAMGELTHTQPKANVDAVAGWDFTWTAPDEPGRYRLFGAGNSVNLNNQNSGDRSSATILEIVVEAMTPTPTSSPTPGQTFTITPTHAPVPCVGDCDSSGAVSINELITGVNISLGNLPITACADVDRNASGTVEINELIAAVNGALFSCE